MLENSEFLRVCTRFYLCNVYYDFNHLILTRILFTDVNECLLDACITGRCENTAGSFNCICDPGLVLEGNVCVDLDECLRAPCTNGSCINLVGSYRCQCSDGFISEGDACYGKEIELLNFDELKDKSWMQSFHSILFPLSTGEYLVKNRVWALVNSSKSWKKHESMNSVYRMLALKT